jgi:transposase
MGLFKPPATPVRHDFMAAHNALAHKLARAAYYVMWDNVIFQPEKLFI